MQTSAAVRLCLSPSLLLWGGNVCPLGCFPTQTVSCGCSAALYPSDLLGGTRDVFIGRCLIMASFDKHTHTRPPLFSNIHFSSAKHTSSMQHTLSFRSYSLSAAHTHAYAPFGCNKTADQSHWLLTGTDTEICCCWTAAWEMFITHKACRFGQERNNGLIKWRPGAAVGEIHTLLRVHPHGLRESLTLRLPPSAPIGCEKLGLSEKF